jgi:WhiB family transcriptional regulator, redox-sensing transcriptional regulator
MRASISASWAERAACLAEPPDLFFPIGASGPPEHVARAKAVCLRCPVREQCLAYALETAQQGIWGGLTEDERSRARLRTQRASQTTRETTPIEGGITRRRR